MMLLKKMCIRDRYISNPPGLYVAIGAAGVLLGLCLLTDGGKKEKGGAAPEAAHAKKK